VTAAEIRSYVALTAPNIRKGGDALGSIFNPGSGGVAHHVFEVANDQLDAVESHESYLGVGLTLDSPDGANGTRKVAQSMDMPYET
jgi:hypothetical protein